MRSDLDRGFSEEPDPDPDFSEGLESIIPFNKTRQILMLENTHWSEGLNMDIAPLSAKNEDVGLCKTKR